MRYLHWRFAVVLPVLLVLVPLALLGSVSESIADRLIDWSQG